MTLDELLEPEPALPDAGLHMLEQGSAYREPVAKCGNCGNAAHAEWVDIGFGPFTQQAGPFHCYSCGWTEGGCPQEECLGARCTSWDYCKGEALVKGDSTFPVQQEGEVEAHGY